MTTTIDENMQKVVKFVQELLLDEADRASVTPSIISEKIDSVLSIKPAWNVGLDRDVVTQELIRRFSLWIGQATTLKSDVGHESWLNAERKKDWRYWQRYREWMERRHSWKAMEALDDSTDLVLGLLEDPKRADPWDRRGLVVGHVQSGKTGNYTGLICKGADAGYKIIIVLAGLHNNLRSQTQMRLDEGFLGYETKLIPEDIRVIGVGEIDGDPAIRPNYATNRSDDGDFSVAIARNLGITPEQRPWLFVVKKNKTVLERLLRWISHHVSNSHDPVTGRKLVTHLPLLLIDDEADHASVDTGEQVFDDEGKPDEEHEPTAINRRIRKILHAFTHSAYVGYTATPFANIFIHERGETLDEGPDLFPSAFIVNLSAPSNYVGPKRVFGRQEVDEGRGELPLVRHVSDFSASDGVSGWIPRKHNKEHIPLYEGSDELPPSMLEAIDAFLLACAARQVRGHGRNHSSMLVHVTRFTKVQREVHRQIEERIRHLRQRLERNIEHETVFERLRLLWENDFVPTSRAVRAIHKDDGPLADCSWLDIRAALPGVLQDIQVKIINGTAKDALDYMEQSATGLKVIAVGGDKLARGLTLEGLCVSYFLRASKMYDTLMQMGRWFGYRPDYLDLCRLYTTSELTEWFEHIAEAADELRAEFDLMADRSATPREYGLKVQSHSVLMVTSRLKMRVAKTLFLSFSGQLLETVALYRDKQVLDQNLEATRRLLGTLGAPETNPVRVRGSSRQQWTGFLWSDVSANEIIEFLTSYRTHSEAYKVNSVLLSEFIQTMTVANELTHWTVAVIGGGEGAPFEIADGVAVNLLKRADNGPHANRYSIGRLMSTRDEAIDLDEKAWLAALATTRQAWRPDPARNPNATPPDVPNGPAIRLIRGFGAANVPAHPERGLLLIYALDPRTEWTSLPEGSPTIIAIGVSFPGSDSGRKVEYKVNNVLWEQEYGASN